MMSGGSGRREYDDGTYQVERDGELVMLYGKRLDVSNLLEFYSLVIEKEKEKNLALFFHFRVATPCKTLKISILTSQVLSV